MSRLITLVCNSMTLTVDTVGAKIVSFKLGNQEMLGGGKEKMLQGSTFWVSPQSSWCKEGKGCWPPLVAHDSAPYNYFLSNNCNTLTLLSPIDPYTKTQIVKVIAADKSRNQYNMNLNIINRGDKAAKFAPWTITRVDSKSINFFQLGDQEFGKSTSDIDLTYVTGDVGWFNFPNVEGKKIYRDGGNDRWLANYSNGVVFLMRHSGNVDPKDSAPGESEIELYSGVGYIELELQGAYTNLNPNEGLSWDVMWTLFAPYDTSSGTALLSCVKSALQVYDVVNPNSCLM
jgi:hypothetical protein